VLAVDIDGTGRRFTGARQADADVGGLRLAGAVDDAAHHGETHGLDTLIARLPFRHALANIPLDAFRQLLECRTGGAAAARAGGDAGREAAQAERLQQLAGGVDLFASIAARPRRQRHANGVANPFVQQDPHGRRRPHQALRPHAGFGEPQVQRLIGLARQRAIDLHQMPRL
jgi:hypothetical protein